MSDCFSDCRNVSVSCVGVYSRKRRDRLLLASSCAEGTCVDERKLPSGSAKLVFRATQPSETLYAVLCGIRVERRAACCAQGR